MLTNLLKYTACLYLCIFFSCQRSPKVETDPDFTTPAWTKQAIWYQIFPERFRNGDPSNDPTLESLFGSWPYVTEEDRKNAPENWAITPWGEDWYKKDEYFFSFPDTGFYCGIQSRRYGGDLQGVMDKLDYLEELGITAIYFNPLNDSPSLHKYDAAHYRHIDRHFGPDPNGDSEIIQSENPVDPETWQWTSADRLFLKLIDEMHQRKIRVIMDYSWNHTGINFWAFRDVKEKGKESPYADWYYIYSFDDPDTPQDEFSYKAWFGATTLPELKEDIVGEHHEGEPLRMIEGNFTSQDLKHHIFQVTKRWMDPDGNGDPSDGVDGFRLDVAVEVPMGFWREYRQYVKTLNPEAYLVGEVWWEQWPDRLIDPAPFLGEAFDAVMNYRWYREARRLFAHAGQVISPSVFISRIDSMYRNLDFHNSYSMMNVMATHDTPRLTSSLYNKNKYKYHSTPRESDYRIGKPGPASLKVQKMVLLHQFTFTGAPHIYYGDEVGMWGADDPDCRKPMWWDDIEFEAERIHPTKGLHPEAIPVGPDNSLKNYYSDLVQLRKAYPVLSKGEINFTYVDDARSILAYERSTDSDLAVIVFNIGNQAQKLDIPVSRVGTFLNPLTDKELNSNGRVLAFELGPKEGCILIKT